MRQLRSLLCYIVSERDGGKGIGKGREGGLSGEEREDSGEGRE